MIPRQFHWVWLGAHPLPTRDQTWMQTWRELHPDWQCIIWSEYPDGVRLDGFEARDLPLLINRQYYEAMEQWVTGSATVAARSDLIRCEVIARYGGVYLDTDVQCLRNIEPLLEGVRLCIADGCGGFSCNYMFGAVPNHPALWTAVRDLGPHLLYVRHRGDPVLATGPRYLHYKLRRAPDLVIFPYLLFNPLSSEADHTQVTKWPECSYGNHHFDGKWLAEAKIKSTPPDEFRAKATECP